VLDFQDTAGFLCPPDTRRTDYKRHYARQRETPVLDFHVVSSQKPASLVDPSCKHREHARAAGCLDCSGLLPVSQPLTGTFALRIVRFKAKFGKAAHDEGSEYG
jgi:hypothetical protein